MQALLENPKYIAAGLLILIALIVLIYFLIKSIKSYDLEGNYYLHPMKFISCKVKKTNKKDEFSIKYMPSRNILSYKNSRKVNEVHPDLESKIGKFKMTGDEGPLGQELIYIEDGKQYTGVKLKKKYNIYADINDILVLLNEDTRESMVFKKIEKGDL